ncbi:MAG: cytochrome c biogenesis protein ResB, partial [Deltaproteobacteria bacterium]|nr:cytochrome c biogenesis protein ResB [Deltaproteobacteria bacterium]
MSKSKNVLRSFFSSIKLTIALLVLLVLLFMAATFIPRPYGIAWLADLYHSPLFYILMGLLSINLIICSINRLPVTLRQCKSTHPPPSVLFENLENERIIFTDKIDAACRAVDASLTAKFSSVKKLKTAKGIIFYREGGRFSLFGVYIVHLSILIIIAAAIIGSVFGLEADVHLQEGESASVIQLNKDKGPYQLDFSVRCDQFVVEFYHTGAPKTYRSALSFIREGNVVHKGSVLVNHPLTFEGF